MKKQLVKMEKPVPSLKLYKLEFDSENKQWFYVYCFEVPSLLTSKKRKNPLYFQSGFHSMVLTNEIKDFMVNIEIRSIDDLEKMMFKQMNSDLQLRKEFEKSLGDQLSNFEENTFTLKNKTQKANGAMIVKAKSMNDDSTVFIGRAGE